MVKRVCLEFLVLSQNSEIDSEDRCSFFPSKTHFRFDHPYWLKHPLFLFRLNVLRCKKPVSCWMVWVLNFSGRLGGFWETRDWQPGGVSKTRWVHSIFPCFFLGVWNFGSLKKHPVFIFAAMSEFNINIKGGRNTLDAWLDRTKRRRFGLSIWEKQWIYDHQSLQLSQISSFGWRYCWWLNCGEIGSWVVFLPVIR